MNDSSCEALCIQKKQELDSLVNQPTMSPQALLLLKRSLAAMLEDVKRRNWQSLQRACSQLDIILSYQSGTKDEVILEYVCNTERNLFLSLHDVSLMKELCMDVQQMLASLETPELQKIRAYIHTTPDPMKRTPCCGIGFFFAHKRKLLPLEAEVTEVIEDTLAQLPLKERQYIRTYVDNSESLKVQQAFRFIPQKEPSCFSRVRPL